MAGATTLTFQHFWGFVLFCFPIFILLLHVFCMGRGTTHSYRGALWEVRGPPERADSPHHGDLGGSNSVSRLGDKHH